MSPEETSVPACLERWCVIPGRVQEHSCPGPLFPYKRPSFPRGDMDRWHIPRALLGRAEGFQLWACHGHNKLYVTSQQKGCSEAFLSPRPERESLRDSGYGGPSLDPFPNGLVDPTMTKYQTRRNLREGLEASSACG